MAGTHFRAGRCAFGVFLLFSSIYLLSMSCVWIHLDGPERYSLTKAIARGSVSVGQDENGRAQYVKYGLGQPILVLPFYISGRLAQAVWGGKFNQAGDFNQLQDFCSNLYNQFVTGALCAFLFLCLIELEYAAGTAFFVTAVSALATALWPNARWFGNEPTAALLLLLVFYFMLRIVRRKQGSWEWAGLGASGMMAIVNNPIVAPLIFLMPALAIYGLRREGGGGIRKSSVALCFAFLLAGMAIAMAYNQIRYGSVLKTGYEGDHGYRAFPENIYSGLPGFSAPFLVALYGNLLSSGRSIFIYSPSVLLGVLFFVKFWHRNRRAATFVALASLFYLIVYSKWWCWYGGACWGNRMLLPIVPLLMCLAAEAWEQMRRSRATKLIFVLVSLSGLLVQVLAVVVFYERFHCSVVSPTFQREFLIHFVPSYSPLAGQVALLRNEGLANHDLFLLATLRDMPVFATCAISIVLATGVIGALIIRNSLRCRRSRTN